MSFDGLANSLNGYLSIYCMRFFVVFLTFLFLIVGFVVWKFFLGRMIVKICYLFVQFISILCLSVLPFFIYNTPIVKESLLGSLYTLLPLILLFFASILFFLSVIEDESKNQREEQKIYKKVFGVFGLSSLLISLFFLSLLVIVSLFARPYIVLLGVEENTTVEESQSIKIKLTVPILKDSFKLSVFPEQDVDIKYDYVSLSRSWIDGFEISPTENYPAESRVVLYVTGLSNIIPGGSKHEQSLEFFTPTLPVIVSTNLDDTKEDISVDTNIDLILDKSDSFSTKWDFELIPNTEFELVKNGGNKMTLDFKSLAQGTTYKLKVLRGNRIYRTDTQEEIKVNDVDLHKEFTFKTVDAPGIKGFNWNNVMLPNTEPLVIEFTDGVNLDTFTNLYSIEPSIGHTISIGSNGSSLVIKPNGAFAKDTAYKVIFKKGLKTLHGGYLEEDSVISFKTAGVVRVAYYTPRNGAVGVTKNLKSISVVFDQRVDHASAESRFAISPSVPGSFSWSGNSMIYTLAAPLEYYTRYTISVSSGVKSIYGIDSNANFSGSFTTEEQVVILKVPQFYQPKGFDCNLYAVKMALAYRGISVDPNGLKSSIGIGEDPNSSWVESYGVHWGPLSRVIGSYRSNSIRAGWNVSALATEIMNGNPSIVYVYNGASLPYGVFELSGGYTGYMGMHSEVVVGFTGRADNPTSIITNDPWKGRRKHSIGNFYGIWGYLGNRAIVVY